MIWIAQLLCPQRHAILACAFREGVEADYERKTEELFRKGVLKRHCGICGSYDLHWEKGRTSFQTIKQCEEAMTIEAFQQSLTRSFLEANGQTFDSSEKN